MEANAGKSFQMQILFNIFPRISLHCKLVLVQYWECEYGLLIASDGRLSVHNVSPYITYLPRKDGGDRLKHPSFSDLFIVQGS